MVALEACGPRGVALLTVAAPVKRLLVIDCGEDEEEEEEE
jgi:hypothetical protein